MVIAEDFIFLHIPRTGGKSFRVFCTMMMLKKKGLPFICRGSLELAPSFGKINLHRDDIKTLEKEISRIGRERIDLSATARALNIEQVLNDKPFMHVKRAGVSQSLRPLMQGRKLVAILRDPVDWYNSTLRLRSPAATPAGLKGMIFNEHGVGMMTCTLVRTLSKKHISVNDITFQNLQEIYDENVALDASSFLRLSDIKKDIEICLSAGTAVTYYPVFNRMRSNINNWPAGSMPTAGLVSEILKADEFIYSLIDEIQMRDI